ncbi:hypothetical protein Goklo_026950, partial [Gossypium klotzschianum]|nr:hypothetical protein [Gossypium klotzschianum]
HFLYDAPPRNLCSKLRFKFNNGVGLKRKRTLTTLEEEDDREWEAPKPKLKRSKKQHKAVCQLPPPGIRFSIPFSQVKTHDFLNEAEAKDLAHKNPMLVCLLDPSLKQTSITFNKCVMGNTSLYVLTDTWNSVVKNNQLEKGVMVQLWSFRVNSLLCFALLKL